MLSVDAPEFVPRVTQTTPQLFHRNQHQILNRNTNHNHGSHNQYSVNKIISDLFYFTNMRIKCHSFHVVIPYKPEIVNRELIYLLSKFTVICLI